MRYRYSPKRIARLLQANADALAANIITFDQFHIVQLATWGLVDRGEQAIIGSPCSRRIGNVQRELAKLY